MLTFDPDKKLEDILRYALESDRVDIRDAAVTYIAMTDLNIGLDLIEKYAEHEEIDWLKEYAFKVLDHLYKKQAGFPSRPPGKPKSRP